MNINNIEKASELKREIDALRVIASSHGITIMARSTSWNYNTSENSTPYMREAIAKLLYERIKALEELIEKL